MNLRSRKVVRTVQIILGLFLLFTGTNAIFNFAPAPEFNEAGSAFLGALFNTGYMFPLLGIVWILIGILFIFNKCSPLAAVILLPISINIIFFHIFLDFTGFYLGLIFFVLNIYLLYIHWNSYRPMCGR